MQGCCSPKEMDKGIADYQGEVGGFLFTKCWKTDSHSMWDENIAGTIFSGASSIYKSEN